ncbi:hypothetical protein, partial [Nocardiopsis halotolerans]|uniref:hypothetical protein n=1 Tax=Nocardiopsis halotolerans TaxID=124252 RepID=UPI000475D3F1
MRTLDRMLIENDPEEVVANINGSRDRLIDSRILREAEDGYVVELDKEAWHTEGVDGLARVDDALIDAMESNTVTWCGEPVRGNELVDSYMEEFWDTLDSHE